MIKEGSLVFPGDTIATSEELFPGYGTKDIGGDIVGTMIGNFFVDKKRPSAEIKPLTSVPLVLKKGDTVICEVEHITDKMVLANILHAAGVYRKVVGENEGAIRVSDIAKEYVVSAKDKYKIGDIIRAQVIQVEPTLRLSTNGAHLGSIKSFCIGCRAPLVKKDFVLECPRCGRIEERKIASDYGEGNIDKR
ncbi:MAG: exosome complex RNA-binding protein Csl4 [Candidatus Thermoplasmatota archaeon]|nr:exosome complex RNA-binding protein Csl4 [Candidatus Thermoplasmatota archaeon]